MGGWGRGETYRASKGRIFDTKNLTWKNVAAGHTIHFEQLCFSHSISTKNIHCKIHKNKYKNSIHSEREETRKEEKDVKGGKEREAGRERQRGRGRERQREAEEQRQRERKRKKTERERENIQTRRQIEVEKVTTMGAETGDSNGDRHRDSDKRRRWRER